MRETDNGVYLRIGKLPAAVQVYWATLHVLQIDTDPSSLPVAKTVGSRGWVASPKTNSLGPSTSFRVSSTPVISQMSLPSVPTMNLSRSNGWKSIARSSGWLPSVVGGSRTALFQHSTRKNMSFRSSLAISRPTPDCNDSKAVCHPQQEHPLSHVAVDCQPSALPLLQVFRPADDVPHNDLPISPAGQDGCVRLSELDARARFDDQYPRVPGNPVCVLRAVRTPSAQSAR